MSDEMLQAAILLGNALKPDFEEMDAVFRKYLLPDLEQVVAKKVAELRSNHEPRPDHTTL